jgi:sugar-specific transcriptional regulator TrmB
MIDIVWQFVKLLTMKETLAKELMQLGLTGTEAQVYLALVQNGAMGASAIAAATGLARTAVYPTLGALVDKGFADAGEGYGSRFSPVPAEQVLPHLLAADKAALFDRERLTAEVIERISSLEEHAETGPDELIQVLRSPRAIGERFERLQLEAERSIDCFIKGLPLGDPSNPTQEKAQRRGVHYRGLYESVLLDEPATKARVLEWTTMGEEVRVYHGELPHKLVIVDSKVVLMPLVRSGESIKTVVIRHPELAQTLSLAFQYLWDRAEPLAQQPPRKAKKSKAVPIKPATHRNDKPSVDD